VSRVPQISQHQWTNDLKNFQRFMAGNFYIMIPKLEKQLQYSLKKPALCICNKGKSWMKNKRVVCWTISKHNMFPMICEQMGAGSCNHVYEMPKVNKHLHWYLCLLEWGFLLTLFNQRILQCCTGEGSILYHLETWDTLFSSLMICIPQYATCNRCFSNVKKQNCFPTISESF
jgi:hypothetical protein